MIQEIQRNLITQKFKSTAGYFIRIAILALIYHLAARLGLKMAYVQVNTSPVWPPTGIALAALLVYGYRLWPGVSLGVFLGSIITGAPFNVAIGMTIGNTLEALTGFYLLKRVLGFHNELDRIQDVVYLALVAGFSTAISATVGTATLVLVGSVGQNFSTIWLTWWIGNLLGALVVAPMLLVWAYPFPLRIYQRQYLEGGILILLLGGITWYVFSSRSYFEVFHQALIYVIFPFIIWAALRLGPRGAATTTVLVSGIAIFGTVQGSGPFTQYPKNDSLILLQTFMGVVSLTSLILAAAAVERRKATEALHQRISDLVFLNDSSRNFLDYSDHDRIYTTICQLAVSRLGVDAAWIETDSHDGLVASPMAYCGTSIETLIDLKKAWENENWKPSGNKFLIKTRQEIPQKLQENLFSYSAIAVFPLMFGNELLGKLFLASKNPHYFTEERLLLIQSYTNLAAVALQNAWLVAEVHRGNKQLHALSQRLMQALEEERLHLARELHDESGQLLAALTVQLGMLDREKKNPDILGERIAELKSLANKIQDNLHNLAVNLRPASLDHLGLVKTLQQYFEEFSRHHGLKIEFEVVGMEDKRLPIEVETALFRIVQESLTNVVRHAQATSVDVLITQQQDRIVTIIEDDGIGFIPVLSVDTDHLGLFGMRERIEMLGGALTIESSLGKGTTVKAEVPYHD
jgi:signal transduction histidine kinase